MNDNPAGMPGMNGAPGVTGPGGMSGPTGTGGMPGANGMGSMPGASDMSGMPGANGMGSMPGANGAPGANGMPGAPVPMATMSVNSLDPTGRPMEKVVPVAPPVKKKKTGLIVGIIVAAVVIIALIVTLIVLLLSNQKDESVSKAVQKYISGDTPTNLHLKADININTSTAGSPVKSLNLSIDSKSVQNSSINSTDGVVSFTTFENKDFDAQFHEVGSTDGSVYFKIDGFTDSVKESGILNYAIPTAPSGPSDCVSEVEGDCSNGATVDTLSPGYNTALQPDYTTAIFSAASILELTENLDGKWFKLSQDDVGKITNDQNKSDQLLSCLTSLSSEYKQNANTVAGIYSKHPFISSTTEGVTLEKEEYPVHSVIVDPDNLTEFINASLNTNVGNSTRTCFGVARNANSIEAEAVAEFVNSLPEILVEVDEQFNFTRLYTIIRLSDDVTAYAELHFDYPENVNVKEPEDYIDLRAAIEQIDTEEKKKD